MNDPYSDDRSTGRNFQSQQPYTAEHPIPTVQRYREELKQRDQKDSIQANALNEAPQNAGDFVGKVDGEGGGDTMTDTMTDTQDYGDQQALRKESWVNISKGGQTGVPTPEDSGEDEQPKADFKEGKEPKERKVIDPVTHFPILVHDTTEAELKALPDPEDKKLQRRFNTPGDSQGRHMTLHDLIERELKSGFASEDDKERVEYEITIIVGAVAGLAGAVTMVMFCNALGFGKIMTSQLAGLVGVGAAYVASQAMIVRIRRMHDLARVS